MDASRWVWLIAGLLAGVVHATTLWRSTRRLSNGTPVWSVLRLALVAALLVLAARSGVILESAAGWAVGYLIVCAWLVRLRPD